MANQIVKACLIAWVWLLVSPVAAEDVWRSPRMLSSEWPHLSAMDCADYGSDYGFSECAPSPRARVGVPASPLSPRTSPQIKPGHVNASSRPAKTEPESLLTKPVVAERSCVEKMKSCFSKCTASANLPAMCNSTCSTNRQCGTSLKLTYMEFLDLRTELSQIMNKL